jgi:AcrR family transcriptional regulator
LKDRLISPPPSPTPAPRKRADAVQNQARILDAAEEVFLIMGVNAPLDVIAERAGVGRATLFRNFADRHALIVGLLNRSTTELEAEAERIDGDSQALGRLFYFVAQRIIARAPLNEYWMTFDHDSAAFHSAIKRFVTSFKRPLAWALAAGECRPDLTPRDVFLLVTMLSGSLYARTPDERQRLAARAWTFVVEMTQLRHVPTVLRFETDIQD